MSEPFTEHFRFPLGSGPCSQADGYAGAYGSGYQSLRVRHINQFSERIKSTEESYPNGCPIIPESND